jgi:spermidine synthase
VIELFEQARRKHCSCRLSRLSGVIQILTPSSGLGAGIAVSSFARQNIDTTVIEIDPAVYNASRQYFGLPDLGSERVFIRDARAVIAEKRLTALQHSTPDVAKYDYVVHDCFSGGEVPAHLFTVEFWEDLKVIMNPEGVVAVVSRSTLHGRSCLIADLFPPLENFAGRIDSRPAKAILFTLQRSFGQCRVLHDLPLDQLDLIHSFVNLVGSQP